MGFTAHLKVRPFLRPHFESPPEGAMPLGSCLRTHLELRVFLTEMLQSFPQGLGKLILTIVVLSDETDSKTEIAGLDADLKCVRENSAAAVRLENIFHLTQDSATLRPGLKPQSPLRG